MNPPSEIPNREPTPEQIEAALEAMHRGSPEAFDRLLGASGEASSGICGLFLDMASRVTPDVSAPRIIGYEIDRLLGAGGMGVVFAARQTGTGRAVAVKVIRSGSGVGGPADRLFRREIDTLIRLRHPNIADLYDAGTTSDGTPFFAMEFVDGCTLRDYARNAGDVSLRSETGRESLRQFVDICRAMNHAHQRGVIHCDLKPTNVMINSDGAPKVLDFGLSRLIDPEVSTIAAVSASHHLAGTLAYMSPEQVNGPVRELDIRSDVYSLGVMLYELLCGALPHRVADMGIPAAIRAISDAEPKRLSAVRPDLKGDLDAIVMKAMEKDRERRYQSAGDLADDLERALRGEPIEARADRFYLLRRTIYRYRVQAGVAAAFVVVLAAATGVSTGFWYRSQQEAQRAEAEADNARIVGNTAFTVVAEMMDEVHSATEQIGNREKVLTRIENQLDKLLPLIEMDPRMQKMRASMLSLHGEIAHSRGNYPKAKALYEQVVNLLEPGTPESGRAHRLLAGTPGTKDWEEHFKIAIRCASTDADLCKAGVGYALSLIEACRYKDALAILDPLECESEASEVELQKSVAYDGLNKVKEAIEALRLALSAAQREVEAHPEILTKRYRLMRVHTDLAGALQRDGELDEALRHAMQAKEIGERLLWTKPDYMPAILRLWRDLDIIVSIYLDQRNLAAAETSARELVQWTQRLNDQYPNNIGLTLKKPFAEFQLGVVLHSLNRLDEARTVWKSALESASRHSGDDDVNKRNCEVLIAQVAEWLESVTDGGQAPAEQKRYREACYGAYVRLCDISPEVAYYEAKRMTFAMKLASTRLRDRDIDSAQALIDDAKSALTRFRDKGGPDNHVQGYADAIDLFQQDIQGARFPQSAWPHSDD